MKPTENGHLRHQLGSNVIDKGTAGKGCAGSGHDDVYPYPLWHQILFSCLGLVMLGIAAVGTIETYLFLQNSTLTQGKIIGLVSGRRNTLRLRFEFTTLNGEIVSGISSVGSAKSSRRIGDEVDVLYISKDPSHAEINSWFVLWSKNLVFGFMGMAFSIGGLLKQIPELVDYLKRTKFKKWGIAVDTRFERIDRPIWSYRNPRNRPFVVVSSWSDPYSAKIYHFVGKPLWIDPAQNLDVKSIKVYLLARNPNQYWMDLSFLPKTDKTTQFNE